MDRRDEAFGGAADLHIAANLTIKDAGEKGAWTIEGYASTKDLDEVGDIVEPGAFRKALGAFMEFPNLLAFHDFRQPVGKITQADITEDGLWVKAEVSKSEPGVWTKIQEGILKAFSIGFMIDHADSLDSKGGLRIDDLTLLEISVVPLPANRHATFDVAKQVKEWSKSRETDEGLAEEDEETAAEEDVSVEEVTETEDSEPEGEVESPEVNAALDAITDGMVQVDAAATAIAEMIDE